MPTQLKNVPKYQRCTECGWRGDTIDRFISCPECGGFLILKSTQNRSKTKVQKTRTTKRRDDEGYGLHRDPKGKGWSFVEGKSPLDAPIPLSASDSRALNACLIRRGLYRTRKYFKNSP